MYESATLQEQQLQQTQQDLRVSTTSEYVQVVVSCNCMNAVLLMFSQERTLLVLMGVGWATVCKSGFKVVCWTSTEALL